jgi:hypothetical protein
MKNIGVRRSDPIQSKMGDESKVSGISIGLKESSRRVPPMP